MTDPAILFVVPKSINGTDKKRLSDAGVIVIEVADPQSVKLIRPCAELPVSELLAFACDVIGTHSTTSARDAFAKHICDAIWQKHQVTESGAAPPKAPS